MLQPYFVSIIIVPRVGLKISTHFAKQHVKNKAITRQNKKILYLQFQLNPKDKKLKNSINEQVLLTRLSIFNDPYASLQYTKLARALEDLKIKI